MTPAGTVSVVKHRCGYASVGETKVSEDCYFQCDSSDCPKLRTPDAWKIFLSSNNDWGTGITGLTGPSLDGA